MTTSFTKKLIVVNLTLTDGTTFDGTHNTKTVSGLRTHVEVENGGHPSKNKCNIRIYGMREADMNALTTLPAKAGKPLAVHKNIVQVMAGDIQGMNLVFQGEVSEAFASYHTPPNLHFSIKVVSGFYPALAPVPPASFKGDASVVSIMQGLAKQMGYAFENNGVTAQLRNQYLTGSAFQQAAAVAGAANIEFGVDNGTLFIAPRGQPRTGTAPLISAATGLKEYPIFDKKGIKFECLYNSGLKLGGLAKVQSAIPVCCGAWRINCLKHDLSCEDPSGKWLSSVEGSWVGS